MTSVKGISIEVIEQSWFTGQLILTLWEEHCSGLFVRLQMHQCSVRDTFQLFFGDIINRRTGENS